MDNVNEWSLEFDLLYQNITSNQAPGLTEYEKSVFLTRAQEAVVVMLYNGTLKDSFEETEEITDYLDTLVKTVHLTVPEDSMTTPRIISTSEIFALPDDLLFRTLELCTLDVEGCGEMEASVVPVTQDEFWRTRRNPFKGPNKSRVLRLAFAVSDEQRYSELVSKYDITSYTVRYLARPEPIILTDLVDGLSINGESNEKTCKLPKALHQTILVEAVKAAKAVWAS